MSSCTKAPPQPAGCILGWFGVTVRLHRWVISRIWTHRPFSVMSHDIKYECEHCRAEREVWGLSDAQLMARGIDIPDEVRERVYRPCAFGGTSWHHRHTSQKPQEGSTAPAPSPVCEEEPDADL